MPLTKQWGPYSLTRTKIPDDDSTLSPAHLEYVYTPTKFDALYTPTVSD